MEGVEYEKGEALWPFRLFMGCLVGNGAKWMRWQVPLCFVLAAGHCVISEAGRYCVRLNLDECQVWERFLLQKRIYFGNARLSIDWIWIQGGRN